MPLRTQLLLSLSSFFLAAGASLPLQALDQEAWSASIDTIASTLDTVSALAVDREGNSLVTGRSSGDFLTVKYDAGCRLLWEARRSGPRGWEDSRQVLAVDTAGDSYITGSVGEYPRSDCVTIRYDLGGNLVWEAVYDGPARGYDASLAITVDSSGNVFVVGTSSDETGSGQILTIAYDPAGRELWSARAGRGKGLSVLVDERPGDAGGIIVGGTDELDLVVVKYDRQGRQLWRSPLVESSAGTPVWGGASLDGAGNIYLAGSAGEWPAHDFLTAKLDEHGQRQWLSHYVLPNGGVVEARAIVLDATGNVVVTGTACSMSAHYVTSSCDFLTLKYSPDGNRLWAKVHAGSGKREDTAKAIAADRERNIYVSGESWAWAGGEESKELITLKYDPEGKEEWAASHPVLPRVDCVVQAVSVSPQGTIFIAGTESRNHTGTDYTIVEYSQRGEELCAARHDTRAARGSDVAKAIAIDKDGNVIVAGESAGFGLAPDSVVVKYDGQGKELWRAVYDSPESGYERVGALAVDIADNVYVTGETSADGMLTVKYDPSGRQLWAVRSPGMSVADMSAAAMTVDGTGNVLVAGCGGTTLKLGPGGEEIWRATLKPSHQIDSGCAYEMAVDDAGNAHVTRLEFLGQGASYLTLKYDPNGQLLWTARYQSRAAAGAESFDWPQAIAVASDGSVYVTGGNGVASGGEAATVKYSPLGAEGWVRRSEGGGGWALRLDAEGNVVVATDTLLTKYDPAGDVLWTATGFFNGSSRFPSARKMALDVAGSIYLAGYACAGRDDPSCGYATWKYSTDGLLVWNRTFQPPSIRLLGATAIAVDPIGNAYVTGTSTLGFMEDVCLGCDIVTIKYAVDQPVVRFRRGDCNGDGEVSGNVADAAFLLAYNFLGGPTPPCLASCDVNGDGQVTGQVTDAVYLLNFNFLGGPAPPAPFPECGEGQASDLGCERPPDCAGH